MSATPFGLLLDYSNIIICLKRRSLHSIAFLEFRTSECTPSLALYWHRALMPNHCCHKCAIRHVHAKDLSAELVQAVAPSYRCHRIRQLRLVEHWLNSGSAGLHREHAKHGQKMGQHCG